MLCQRDGNDGDVSSERWDSSINKHLVKATSAGIDSLRGIKFSLLKGTTEASGRICTLAREGIGKANSERLGSGIAIDDRRYGAGGRPSKRWQR